MEKVFLLLGTNIGNLKANLNKAVKALEKKDIIVRKKSRRYKTKPLGYTQQPDFLNQALEVTCPYTPYELLFVLKEIETGFGRKQTAQRWGPRIIDIDIAFYGIETVADENLTIPHKELINRPFAIQLLAEIAPGFIPPHSTQTLSEIHKGFEHDGSAFHSN
jgi:2-amino-4-hydroxy-6-hydroxymethyldihydropteridine diphosphokinase